VGVVQLCLASDMAYICPHCSKEFTKDKYAPTKKYCSRRCKQLAKNEREKCPSERKRLSAASRQYYKDHAAHILKRNKAFVKRNIDRHLYGVYRSNARNRGIVFSITFEVFMSYWRKPCSYCGDEIPSIGIDRMISSVGYIEGNITSCCRVCNWAKSNRDKDTYINHCLKVAKYSSSGDIS
jgi:endogenous inhibitor of DNA gyrase (YacG/DUF329 family)